MTSETRTLIEFGEIAGIELKCPHCSAEIFYPIVKNYNRLANQCPNCSEIWITSPDPNARPGTPILAMRLKEALAALQDLITNADVRAHIRLQINGLPQTKNENNSSQERSLTGEENRGSSAETSYQILDSK